jgi:hypothetical protein
MRRNFFRNGFLTLLLIIFSSACGTVQLYSLVDPTGTATQSVQKTLIPTEVLLPTSTIQWFPDTATPRPLSTPTVHPTINKKPDVGKVILSDVFQDDSLWQTFRSDQGNAVIANEELTLAIQQSAVSIASYADITLESDFYLSMDVTLSICSAASDVYGISFRYGDKDNYDRWLINCLGQSRLERRYGGKMLPLVDWHSNSQIRPGAPQKYSLGIRVRGSSLRFFVNDTFLFEAEDNLLTGGLIGLLARSEAGAPITVSFSNLTVYALE